MSEGKSALEQIIAYAREHWPSPLEWQVSVEEYAKAASVAMKDLTSGKTKNRFMIRLAGISGSGKTSQLLPAAEAYFAAHNCRPVIVAAREFVKYHPHYKEIVEQCSKSEIRKVTDEFATVMLFLVLSQLIKEGFDLILDVSFLALSMEGILVNMLEEAKYDLMTLLTAISPEATEKFLANREWRHSKETEREFVRATGEAIKFYAGMPSRIVMWNSYELEPVYDGPFAGALSVFEKYSAETEIKPHDEEKNKLAKIKYLAG